MPRRNAERTVESVMYLHPDIHAELARQRQAELTALAKVSRMRSSSRRDGQASRLAAIACLLRRVKPTTNKEPCDGAVRHFAS
jgi:hypothetical protein